MYNSTLTINDVDYIINAKTMILGVLSQNFTEPKSSMTNAVVCRM